MDAASWNASLPIIITFLLGILGLWFAIRTEVARVRAELRSEIREVRTELKADIQRLDLKLDAISVRASEYDPERARQRGMALILGSQTRAPKPNSAPSDDA